MDDMNGIHFMQAANFIQNTGEEKSSRRRQAEDAGQCKEAIPTSRDTRVVRAYATAIKSLHTNHRVCHSERFQPRQWFRNEAAASIVLEHGIKRSEGQQVQRFCSFDKCFG